MNLRRNTYIIFIIKICAISALVLLKNILGHSEKIFGVSVKVFFNTAIFLLITSLILQVLLQAYRRRKKIPYNRSDNFIAAVNNSYILLIFISILYSSLKIVDISITQFFTSISIVAAAIVILTKEYFSDVISGFLISFSDIMSIDDHVNIDEQKGTVKDFSLTKTHILTQDGELLILPNSKIFFGQIVNYTKGNKRRVSIPFEIDIKSLDSVDIFERALIQELEEFKDQIDESSFVLRIESINKDAISFKFLYTLNRIDSRIELAIRRKTVRRIVDYIKNKSNTLKD